MSYDTMRLELNPKLLKDISIGDEVTIVVKGTVCRLQDGKDPDAKEKKHKDGEPYDYEPNACIEIDVESRKITAPSAFAKLAEDDEE